MNYLWCVPGRAQGGRREIATNAAIAHLPNDE